MLKRSEHCTSLDLLLLRRFLPFFFAFYDNFYFYFNGFPYIPMTTTATRAATSVKFSLLGSTEFNQHPKNFRNRVFVKNSHFSDTQTKLLKKRNFKPKKLSNYSAKQPTRKISPTDHFGAGGPFSIHKIRYSKKKQFNNPSPARQSPTHNSTVNPLAQEPINNQGKKKPKPIIF